MGKKILLVLVLVIVILISNISVFADTSVTAIDPAKTDNTTKYILKNIYSTSMNFQGESVNWSASLVVENILQQNGEIKPQMKLTIVPKNSAIRWIRYTIITNNGTKVNYTWSIFKNPVVIIEEGPLPKFDDEIIVKIKNENLEEVIHLKNTIPEGTITATSAVNIMVVKYYETYGTYPAENYTYEIELLDGYWIISYDDNDGIGGKAYVVIDSITGATDGIKVEE